MERKPLIRKGYRYESNEDIAAGSLYSDTSSESDPPIRRSSSPDIRVSPSLWTVILSDRVRVYRTGNLYLSYFCLGLCMSIPGPTFLDLQQNVGATTAEMGYALAAKCVGYCVGSILAGILFNRVHRILLFAIALMMLGLTNFIIPFQTDLLLFVCLISLSGLVSAIIDTGGNVLCLDLWPTNPGPFFQALHFHYGVGTVIGPLIVEPFLSPEDNNGTDHKNTSLGSPKVLGGVCISYGIIGALVIAVSLSTFISVFIDRTEIRSNCEKERDTSQANGSFLPKCLIAFGMAFMASYVTVENTYAQFLATFIRQGALKMTKSQGSFMSSTFWGSYCFGRGFGIYGATKFKPLTMLLFNLTVICSTSLVMVFFGQANQLVMWIGSAVLGLGCSSCWPYSIAWMEIYVGISNLVSALFVVSGAAAAFLSALLVAYFMDEHPAVFLYTICASCGLCFLILLAQLIVVRNISKLRYRDLTRAGNIQSI